MSVMHQLAYVAREGVRECEREKHRTKAVTFCRGPPACNFKTSPSNTVPSKKKRSACVRVIQHNPVTSSAQLNETKPYLDEIGVRDRRENGDLVSMLEHLLGKLIRFGAAGPRAGPCYWTDLERNEIGMTLARNTYFLYLVPAAPCPSDQMFSLHDHLHSCTT